MQIVKNSQTVKRAVDEPHQRSTQDQEKAWKDLQEAAMMKKINKWN
jgi:hypothetical protein